VSDGRHIYSIQRAPSILFGEKLALPDVGRNFFTDARWKFGQKKWAKPLAASPLESHF
jgi:hypothetical protein